MTVTYASVMVHVQADPAAQPRMALSAALAARFDARLIGIGALGMRPLGVGTPATLRMTPQPLGAWHGESAAFMGRIQQEQEQIEADLRAAEAAFRQAIPDERKPDTVWHAFAEPPADAIIRQARAADLLVLGRSPGDGDASAAVFPDPGAVVLEAGRPVLLVPPGTDALAAERIVVAWRDTRKSRRAVLDALPFLATARRVLVAAICEEGEAGRYAAEAGAAEVVAHLACHSVTAVPQVQPLQGRSVADDLHAIARQNGADLIVAGGYGHMRLREAVFGGVTRDLLHGSSVCCLLSH